MVRRHVGPGPEICMAVKADGYGHGAVEVSKTAISAGVSRLGVAVVEEGVQLREAGIEAPVLLFSLPVPGSFPLLFRYGIAPFIADRETAGELSAAAPVGAPPLPVHLKLDTGMGRIGCSPEEAPSIAESIAALPGIRLEGVCTHFAAADSADRRFTLEQIGRFRGAVKEIRRRGIDPGILHASNSAAVLDFPEAHFDMIRPGIILYGYYPSRELERFLPVLPVMEFRSEVIFRKRVPADTPVSYGLSYRTRTETVIATIPAGYGDGYNRLLSNQGLVTIRGRRYPVAGRVCMDQFMVDLGPDSDIAVGDEAILFGPEKEALSAEDVADRCGTIPYEITCAISRRVPRVYREG